MCKTNDHIVTTCSCIGDLKPKCVKCGLTHKTKNYGIKCGYYYIMGLIKKRCWKCGKNRNTSFATNNYLKVLVEDEHVILEQLNKFCDRKHDIFSGAKIPRKKLSMETSYAKGLEDKEAKHVNIGKNLNVKSKILNVRNPKTLDPKLLHKGKDIFIPY